MTAVPLCPNCRERMSDVERGLGGVWSCLYCEGVWLPRCGAGESSVAGWEAPLQVGEATATRSSANAEHLYCPACEARSFETRVIEQATFFACKGCASAFLPKGLVHALAPDLVKPNEEAQVPELLALSIASVLLISPELLVAQLASSRKPRSAA